MRRKDDEQRSNAWPKQHQWETKHDSLPPAKAGDKKMGHTSNGSSLDYYNPDIVSVTDYYPFGMVSRSAYLNNLNLNYRYSFNGKENDKDVKGDGNQIDYGARIYDPRLGRFLSVDPISRSYPNESNYVFAGNSPIQFTDFNGYFKISPYFVKRYPTLARILQYYMPLLKYNPHVKEGWIRTIGFSSHAEGEKAFDEMVTYGSGPWVTPTRNGRELRDYMMGGLARFFEPTGDAGGWAEYPSDYVNNLAVTMYDLDKLEASVEKGNAYTIGQQMLIVSILVMHESSHWGKWKYNCCEVNDFRFEMGATFEQNAFGKRFSYQKPWIADCNLQAYNREDVKNYYRQEYGKYGSPTFGLTPNFFNDKSRFWKEAFSGPLKAGQRGDPTLLDNKDEKPYVPKNTYDTGGSKGRDNNYSY